VTGVTANGPAGRHSATGKERIPALDGLRAVALLVVMGYHFGVGWLQGGFFGLDIFYVLSGYLITGLLVSEYARRGRIALGAFWLRRARRLLPALLVVLVAVSIAVRFAEPAGTYPDQLMSSLSALFDFSNWWQIASAGHYFVATGPVYPLAHTWSLAVEEQFYLVWPLVVVAVMHLSRSFARGLRVLAVSSVAGVVASAVEMALLYTPGTDTTRIYFGTDTHAQSILVGSVLACTMTSIQRRRGSGGMAPRASSAPLATLLVVVGLVGLAGTVTLTSTLGGTDAFDYRGGFLVSALSAAAVIVGAVCVPRGPLARVLSVRPLVWIGTISYGAYLWHFPVFVVLDTGRTGQTGPSLLAIRTGATFALAAASFILVERPVMTGTFWRSLKAVGPAAALVGATVAVVVVGATVVPATGAVGSPGHLPAPERASLAAAGAFAGNPVRFMLVGDSMALTLAVGLQVDTVPTYGVQVLDAATLGCDLDDLPAIVSGTLDQPVSDCTRWPTVWADEVASYRPEVVGVLLGRWDITDHLEGGRVVHIGQPGWDAHLSGELRRAVSVLSAGGAKVVLLTMPTIDPPRAPDGSVYPENQPDRVDEFNRILAEVARESNGAATLVDLHQKLDPGGSFRLRLDGVAVRWADGIHITEAEGERLQSWLLPSVGTWGLTVRTVRTVRTGT
jgi:peptidoglycan/LPS O-acetylase OafA/YrhL